MALLLSHCGIRPWPQLVNEPPDRPVHPIANQKPSEKGSSNAASVDSANANVRREAPKNLRS
jgi:hypothetical protein